MQEAHRLKVSAYQPEQHIRAGSHRHQAARIQPPRPGRRFPIVPGACRD